MKLTWSDVGNGVAKVAPWVGSLLGGKAGEAVGNLVAEVLGTEPTPEAVSEELAKNPDAFIRLKEMEFTHKGKLAELQSLDYRATLDYQKGETAAEVDDRKDARSRDIALKSGGYYNVRADLMIVVAFISFIAIAYMINVNADMKPEVLAIFNMAIGALLKMLSDAFQFEFGSSRGSREKDSIIAASPPISK
jgi:hypothetical protein